MLKKIGVALIAAVMMASPVVINAQSGYDIPAQVVSWAKSNAYKVLTGRGSGSGWWLNEHHLITNCHVVDGFDTAVVVNWDNTKVLPVKVAKCDKERDLALLTYFDNDVYTPNVQETVISAESVPYGTGIWGLGYPLGYPMHITQGHVTSKSHYKTIYTQVTSPTVFGDSGSAAVALIDGKVTVIGVRAAIAGVPGRFMRQYVWHMALVINPETIWEFLKPKS